MNIIAVDDEHLSLKSIENVINAAIPNCSLLCFDAPSKAISHAKEHQVDVAFLDIEMGGMNGLQLAKQLKDIYGKTNIVFVTGYSQYAVDAFSIYASGYILKPVSEKAVFTAIEQLRYPITILSDKRLRVQTFGNFEVFVDEKPICFARSKTKELFAYLVSRHGAKCSNNEIIAVIWEYNINTASTQSHFRHLVSDLIYTLKTLGIMDVILKQRGFLAVVPDKFICDLYDFCNGNINAINNYRGEFMAQYSWAEFTNAYLENRI